MKIGIIGDLHVKNHAPFATPTNIPGVNSRLLNVRNVLSSALATLRAYEREHAVSLDFLVQLGDIGHDHGVVDATTLYYIKAIIDEMACYWDTHILTGNHDIDPNGISLLGVFNSYSAPEENAVCVWTEPGFVLGESVSFCFVPYISDENEFRKVFIDCVKEASRGRMVGKVGSVPVVAFVHQHFRGAKFRDEYCPTTGVDMEKPLSELGFLVAVIAGHLHKRQELKVGGVPIIYPGTPLQRTFNEVGNPTGVAVFDTETMSIEYLDKFDEFPKFVDVSYEDITNAWVNPEDLEQKNYHRVICPPNYDREPVTNFFEKINHWTVKIEGREEAEVARMHQLVGEEVIEGQDPVDTAVAAYVASNIPENEDQRAEAYHKFGSSILQKVRSS